MIDMAVLSTNPSNVVQNLRRLMPGIVFVTIIMIIIYGMVSRGWYFRKENLDDFNNYNQDRGVIEMKQELISKPQVLTEATVDILEYDEDYDDDDDDYDDVDELEDEIEYDDDLAIETDDDPEMGETDDDPEMEETDDDPEMEETDDDPEMEETELSDEAI